MEKCINLSVFCPYLRWQREIQNSGTVIENGPGFYKLSLQD